MFPDAKVKVIDAIKSNGEIVAMTGDGVNDGPALKSADIGIAMGKKGTEIARQAADLVLTDDNLERMVTAVEEGRKIFSNLKKAVRYIISIHIPIILTASVFLTFANRSFTETMYYTSRYKNSLASLIIIISVLFLASLHFIPFVRELFQLAVITPTQFGISFAVAFASVMWFEIYKTGLRKHVYNNVVGQT